MRKLILFTLLLSGGMLAGCAPGATQSTDSSSSSLHGGILVPLTDDQCYVELLNDKRELKGRANQTNLVAYLLKPDQKTALSETPTSVEVKILTSKGERKVPLKSSPDSSDPVGSRRFLSPMGPYELNQTAGEVTVLVDGKTLTGKFRGPR